MKRARDAECVILGRDISKRNLTEERGADRHEVRSEVFNEEKLSGNGGLSRYNQISELCIWMLLEGWECFWALTRFSKSR